MSAYYNVWKLRVNIEKNKVMGFSRGQHPRVFFYIMEIANDFNDLCVVITHTCNCKKAKQCQIAKATKALYEILKMVRVHNLSISCQLDLFDKMVKPILLYGCEVWEYGNNEILERVQLKYLKSKSTTASSMINSELGRYPIKIDVKVRMISYWSKLTMGKEMKLSAEIYNLCYQMSHVPVICHISGTHRLLLILIGLYMRLNSV
jgi:hypothetical protein